MPLVVPRQGSGRHRPRIVRGGRRLPVLRVALLAAIAAIPLLPSLPRAQPSTGSAAPSGPGAMGPQSEIAARRQRQGADSAPTTAELLAQAVDDGKLNRETALVCEVYGVFGDPRLPPGYRGNDGGA